MKTWKIEIAVSLFFLLIAGAFFIGTLGFEAMGVNPVDIGPAAFPQLLCIAVAIFSLGEIINALRRSKPANTNLELGNLRKMLYCVFVIAAYIFFLPIAGYFIITPIFVFLIMFILNNRNWKQMILVSIGFTLFVYILFVQVLTVRLP